MLRQIIESEGEEIKWAKAASQLPGRTQKQCRERWHSHLNTNIRKGGWTPEEDDIILNKQIQLGNHWTSIAEFLQGRTDLDVKNRFYVIQRAIKRSTKVSEQLKLVNNIDQQELALPTILTNSPMLHLSPMQDNSHGMTSRTSDLTDSEPSSSRTSDSVHLHSSKSSSFTFQRSISNDPSQHLGQFNYCTEMKSHSFDDLASEFPVYRVVENSSHLSSLGHSQQIDRRN